MPCVQVGSTRRVYLFRCVFASRPALGAVARQARVSEGSRLCGCVGQCLCAQIVGV